MKLVLFWVVWLLVCSTLVIAGTINDEGKPPIAPKACTWVYVTIEEDHNNEVKVPFLICKKLKEV